MKSKATLRLRLDALRRFASSLLAASGVKPDRASLLASHLLWFDEAGFGKHGLATLPGLLERIARGEIDPKAEGKVGPERAATAVLDGHDGPPALILARAAEIASEKAREVGLGLVRVRGIGPVGPAAPIVAEVAVGPMVAAALGPDGAWSLALPAPGGRPLVIDSAFAAGQPAPNGFVAALRIEGEWLVQVLSAVATEPLAALHDRVAEAMGEEPGWPLAPGRLEAPRREAREHGVTLEAPVRTALRTWAERLGVPELR